MVPKDQGIRVNIKPLRANLSYLGTKRRSWKYKTYEAELNKQLPRTCIPREGNLSITFHIYYSNKGSDLDNALKPLLDVLQRRYKFNDNRVYEIKAYKHIVPKGEEAISFKVKRMKE